MMDRSELVRYANDTLLDEFQQRITIQIRYIDNQVAMLKRELRNLEAERAHLNKYFPEQEAPSKLNPNTPAEQTKLNHIPNTSSPIPSWLQQAPEKKAAE
jgi:hypothetical protein